MVRVTRCAALALAAGCVPCALAACIVIGPSSQGGSDGGAEDATTVDGSGEGGGGDGATDGLTDAGLATYHSVTDAASWEAFDLSTVNLDAKDFWGGAFDGRYLYLVPHGDNTALVRYDTRAPLGLASSYRTYYLTSLRAGAARFAGAAFDGRYVYFLPNGGVGLGDPGGVADAGPATLFVRYDTQAPFGEASSFATVDLAALAPGGAGFSGATIDKGKGYLYLAPYDNGENSDGGYDGHLVRYSLAGALDAGGSWQLSNEDSFATGFHGAVFDGTHVYFVPYYANATQQDNCMCGVTLGNDYASVALRYDTSGSFNSTPSFSKFDLHTIGGSTPNANGFWGGVFDGQYVYFVPRTTSPNAGTCANCSACQACAANWGVGCGGPRCFGGCGCTWSEPDNGTVARFDTTGDFTDAGSFRVFDTTTLAGSPKGFAGAVFDGQNVYFAPASSGVVAQYDRRDSFLSMMAWSLFDVSKINPGATSFSGAAFDGRYVYLVPGTGSVIARFDAKSPPSMPPSYSGSFF